MAAKLKHIILRSTRVSTGDVFLGPMAGPRELESIAAGVRVEVEEIDPARVGRVTRHGDVLAVAPSIPMRLVEPFDVAAQPAAGAPSWGIAAVGADTSPFTGEGVVVAVLDTGIDASHPAFAGMTLVQEDFTGEGNGDQHGHGTHCAGTIFGRDVDATRIGVARGVTQALIGKVLGRRGGASDAIVRAIQWAVDHGAHVVSMSIGIDFPGLVADLQQRGLPAELATSRALEGYRANVQLFERLAALIRAQGSFQQATLTVAAAGNESRRDEDPDFRIAVSPPAVAEGVISVAAVGRSAAGFVVAPFSNTGANVAAPGVEILSARAGGGLRAMSGTSMATPHVAGVTALWAQRIRAAGTLSGLQLTSRVVASADLVGFAPGVDPDDVGAGVVRAPQA
jgi:subtilisin family serine protease